MGGGSYLDEAIFSRDFVLGYFENSSPVIKVNMVLVGEPDQEVDGSCCRQMQMVDRWLWHLNKSLV